jgi:DNA end-binding protein Ku
VARAAPKPSNVINLFDALKKSLAGDGGEAGEKASGQRTPARGKPSRARKPAPKSTAQKKRKSA